MISLWGVALTKQVRSYLPQLQALDEVLRVLTCQHGILARHLGGAQRRSTSAAELRGEPGSAGARQRRSSVASQGRSNASRGVHAACSRGVHTL